MQTAHPAVEFESCDLRGDHDERTQAKLEPGPNKCTIRTMRQILDDGPHLLGTVGSSKASVQRAMSM